MRYAVIGTGWIAGSYIQGAARTGHWELAAVYSRKKETGLAFGEKYGVSTVYTNLEELAASDIPAVYIASPNAFHYEQSRMMLEAGKHVICEKPITVTPEGYEELRELAAKKGLIYMEAIMMLHQPHLRAVEDALQKIGKVTSARLDFCQLSSKYPAYLRGELPNIFNPQMATGSLMDLGIYCVYPAAAWFGMPESITAKADFLPTGADISCTAILSYPDFQAVLQNNKNAQSRLGSEIMGEEGTLVLPSISQLTEAVLYDKAGTPTPITGSAEKDALMGNEAADFYRYITDPAGSREEYEKAGELAFQVSSVMEQIRRQAGISFPGGSK